MPRAPLWNILYCFQSIARIMRKICSRGRARCRFLPALQRQGAASYPAPGPCLLRFGEMACPMNSRLARSPVANRVP